MLFNFKTRFLLSPEDEETGGSSPHNEDDEIDNLIKGILDGDEHEDEDEEDVAPKKDPAFTKQFSKRIKEEREKLAKQLGFESYDSAIKGATRKVITDAGYDPDDDDFKQAVEAAVKQRIETDPELTEQRRLIAELKAKETKIWEANQLELLEKEYGVKLKSISDVDVKVKDLMAKGLDLVDAYFIVNKAKLKTKQQTGKEHLHPEGAGAAKGASDGKVIITQDDITRFREYSNGNETDEEIRARLEKLRGATK